MCCGPWGRQESDTTERLNDNKSTPGDSSHVASASGDPRQGLSELPLDRFLRFHTTLAASL